MRKQYVNAYRMIFTTNNKTPTDSQSTFCSAHLCRAAERVDGILRVLWGQRSAFCTVTRLSYACHAALWCASGAATVSTVKANAVGWQSKVQTALGGAESVAMVAMWPQWQEPTARKPPSKR